MAQPPVLFVVMGTSGCGKSTISEMVASRLGLPFIDGDDLHPTRNVEKMSAGQPLDDRDREPWLKIIRQRALDLTTSAHPDLSKVHSHPRQQVQGIAAAFEPAHPAEPSEPKAAPSEQTRAQAPLTSATPRRACVIACSALKRKYRDLLRGEADSLFGDGSSQAHASGPSADLDTRHIYLHVDPDELLRRMHNRKGHFMKEDMLRSQLDTLEEPRPDAEYGIIRVDADAAPERVADEILREIRASVGEVTGPP